MPASWRICFSEPRAPECAIMYTELTCLVRPVTLSICTAEMRSIISLAIWSVHFDQASTTLLYFSSWVMRPSLYCCSYSRTRSLVCSTNLALVSGITMSSLPNEMPALKAW